MALGSGIRSFRVNFILIAQSSPLFYKKKLLDSSDTTLALPGTDFHNIFRRGINDTDVVNLSDDRRVLRVTLNVKNGVDQIRVLVAADNNP